MHESFRRARHSIYIVGWDLHSDLQLIRGKKANGIPTRLGEFLNHLVSKNDQLHVYLLIWDFAMIYALEREFFPRYRLEWKTHRRIRFCLDGHHPIGASQHQKIVVVDDAVAFAGGFDLSKWRWDTTAHRPEDPRRIDPEGEPYPPFHDVQMVVDGPAAEKLGELVRDRWRRANDEEPVASAALQSESPWPESISPDLRNVQVAVARTLPAFDDRNAVGEVRQLYLDSIAAARRYIYIENQYLSSREVGQALEKRLEEADGPETILVVPQKTGGWLEQNTMDVLRARLLRKLREADRHDRLRTYFPRVSKEPDCNVMVHAKVTIIDDVFARVGSSNLSNRSMGLDSECDLAVAAGGEATRSAIARFRARLLADHLAVDAEEVDRACEAHGSLIQAIDSLAGGERTLVPLAAEVPPEADKWVPDSRLMDPEKPVEPNELLDRFIRPTHQPLVFRHLLKVLVLVAAVLALAAIWRWTPAAQWLDVASTKTAAEWVQHQPLTPLLVLLGYVLGGLVVFPITLMIIATVIVFGPWWGLLYALAGAELSALALFGAGRFLGRNTVRRFAGSLVNRLSQKLSGSGLAAVMTFRIVPVAPFSVINLIAGASEIRLRDFALGTLVGMIPGVAAICLLADRVAASLRQPGPVSITALGLIVLLVAGGLIWLRRYVKSKRAERAADPAR